MSHGGPEKLLNQSGDLMSNFSHPPRGLGFLPSGDCDKDETTRVVDNGSDDDDDDRCCCCCWDPESSAAAARHLPPFKPYFSMTSSASIATLASRSE